MRKRGLRLALALLALPAARTAQAQPCTLSCANITVTAKDVLTPILFPINFFEAADCKLRDFVCTPPNGSGFPVGTTPVSCTATASAGQQSSCQFQVNVVAPTDANLTMTDDPYANPVPGTSQSIGASLGLTDVFYSSTGQFNVHDEGTFTFSFSAQGFVPYNCAPIDDGVSCIGAKNNELTIAEIGFCGENLATISFLKVPDQNFNLTAGVFFTGWAHGDICAGTVADGKAFHYVSGSRDNPFTFATMPQGSRMQDLLPFGRGCAAIGTGNNGFFFFSRNEPSSFVPLGYTPDSATPSRSGNIFVTNAEPKLREHNRSGEVVAAFDLPNRMFRVNAIPPNNINGFVAPRSDFAWSPDFKHGLLHRIFGEGSNVVNLNPAPGDKTIYYLNDPVAARTFPRRLTHLVDGQISWTRGTRRIRFNGEGCHQTVTGR